MPKAVEYDHASSSDGDPETGEGSLPMDLTWPNVPLEPDTFGITICAMVRDFRLLTIHKGYAMNRYWRLASTFCLLAMCLLIQVFLLAEVKKFVSAKAVHDVRKAYDAFEDLMYDGHVEIIGDTPFTERRGIGGPRGPHFDATSFHKLSEDDQASACRIPLSQPLFFFTVLFIWTLTCAAELRKCKELFESLILNTETCDTMKDSLAEDKEDDDEGTFLIAKLTNAMKISLFLMVIVPRVGITVYLIWIGCRWLLATNNFSDLILNSVALEFILSLKDVLYLAVVSRRSMLDVENTNIRPSKLKEPENLAAFVGTFSWAIFAAVWVAVYMGWPGHDGLQEVLREYQWDVHEVCTSWIGSRYAV